MIYRLGKDEERNRCEGGNPGGVDGVGEESAVFAAERGGFGIVS